MVQTESTYSCLDYLKSLANESGFHGLCGHVEYKTHQCINPNVRKAVAKVPFTKWCKAEIKGDSIVQFSKAVFPYTFQTHVKLFFMWNKYESWAVLISDLGGTLHLFRFICRDENPSPFSSADKLIDISNSCQHLGFLRFLVTGE